LIIVKPQTQTIAMNSFCELNCEHCKGYFLEGMQGEIDESVNSYLISGGCCADGSVPLDFNLMKDMRTSGKKINVHSGLVSEDTAKKLGRYADVVSFDFISDDKIIKSNYHLDKKEEDFVESYKLLRQFARVVPHLLIGLGNEKRSMDLLRKLGCTEIAFIVLMKLPGIENDLKEPTLDYIENVLKYGRKFELVHMGCMRPMAKKLEIDQMAIKYVDSIVNPHKDVDFGDMDLVEKDVCCVI